MNSSKRNNRFQAPVEKILVGTVNTSLPNAGSFVGTGDSLLNVTNGSLGLISRDLTSADEAYGDFVSTANASAVKVKAVELIQGTPNSTQLSLVNPYDVNDRAFVGSGYIHADKLVSVEGIKYAPGQYSAQLVKDFSTPIAQEMYRLSVILQSQKRDIEYSDKKRDENVATYSFEGTVTNALDLVLQNLASRVNLNSLYVKGHKPYVVFGVKYVGGSGTTIGDIAKGTQLPFLTHEGITYNYTVNVEFVQSVMNAITENAGLADATIETIDITTAGAAAKIDTLLVVGLDEPLALGFDDSISRKTRVSMHTTLDGATFTKVSLPRETVGSGRDWKIRFEQRMALYIHTLQNKDHGDYPIQIPVYIDENKNYNSVVISHYGEEAEGINKYRTQQLIVLLEATIADDTIEAYNSSTTTVNAFSITTTASTLKDSLNTVFGAWLADASDKFSGVQYLGASTKAAPFL